MGLVVSAYGSTRGTPALPIRHTTRLRGNTTRTRKLDLAASTYVTGGMPLNEVMTGLSKTTDMEVLAGFDPVGTAIQANGYQVVYISDANDGKIQLWYNGAEVANASSSAAGKYVWVRFIGLG